MPRVRLDAWTVNLLYLGMRVLVLADISYLSRFWTQFEAWLSMQAAGPDGLQPARAERRRSTFVCIRARSRAAELATRRACARLAAGEWWR